MQRAATGSLAAAGPAAASGAPPPGRLPRSAWRDPVASPRCCHRAVPQIGKAGAPVTRISQAYADRVEVRGRDLCGDLMGRLSFTEYFHLLLTGREPTDDQRFFLDLLLVSIAEHGLMPSNVAARMTLAADPDRKSTRLNSSHVAISYAVFCL